MKLMPLLLAVPFFFSASLTVHAAESALTRADVEGIVKDYIAKNPEAIVDSLKAYQKNQKTNEEAKAQETLKTRAKDLFEDPAAPSVGAKKPDITVVEFFDYHCGYCKRMLPTVNELIKSDPKVRFVFREFPILSEDSTLASKAALAVYQVKPDKYFEYHQALMNMSGKYDEDKLAAEAEKLGINTDKFKKALGSPEVEKELARNKELGEALGVRGTPFLIVGDEFVGGAAPIDELREIIKKQREKAKAKK